MIPGKNRVFKKKPGIYSLTMSWRCFRAAVRLSRCCAVVMIYLLYRLERYVLKGVDNAREMKQVVDVFNVCAGNV